MPDGMCDTDSFPGDKEWDAMYLPLQVPRAASFPDPNLPRMTIQEAGRLLPSPSSSCHGNGGSGANISTTLFQ